MSERKKIAPHRGAFLSDTYWNCLCYGTLLDKIGKDAANKTKK